MKTFKTIAFLLVLSIAFVSCKKDEVEPAPVEQTYDAQVNILKDVIKINTGLDASKTKVTTTFTTYKKSETETLKGQTEFNTTNLQRLVDGTPMRRISAVQVGDGYIVTLSKGMSPSISDLSGQLAELVYTPKGKNAAGEPLYTIEITGYYSVSNTVRGELWKAAFVTP